MVKLISWYWKWKCF